MTRNSPYEDAKDNYDDADYYDDLMEELDPSRSDEDDD